MDADFQKPPSVSVVIPCWRDVELALGLCLRDLGADEIVVVLAGGDARACDRLRAAGAQVLAAERPNRGRQLHAGAARASGDVLLFQHADSELTRAQVGALRGAMADGRWVGGAFHRKFDDRHPALRWIEPIERRRARWFGTLFGDQSIFVRRTHYEAIGGFRDLPLMEDVEFSRRLRRSGRITLLDPPMETSPRTHRARGAVRTSLRNGFFLLLFHLGVPPSRLHAWYYSTSQTT